MKTYLSFFRMRFINGLQYRAAAYAGISTQFAWGFMRLLMFSAFYKSDPANFPMEFGQLATYIWLQQVTLSFFAAWAFENDIFQSITSGDIAYELCRPAGLYWMWFARSTATRVSRMVLRCAPILVIAAVLPHPYGLSLPASPVAFLQFIISLVLGLLIMVGINMLVYISSFYTLSPMGMRLIFASLVEILAGGVIPLPFMPTGVQNILQILPFASMQNSPFNIYNGYISGISAYYAILLQLAWVVALIGAGAILMNRALKKVIVQGG